jgi:hypothetical protein
VAHFHKRKLLLSGQSGHEHPAAGFPLAQVISFLLDRPEADPSQTMCFSLIHWSPHGVLYLPMKLEHPLDAIFALDHVDVALLPYTNLISDRRDTGGLPFGKCPQ